jgi:hypothetical protein
MYKKNIHNSKTSNARKALEATAGSSRVAMHPCIEANKGLLVTGLGVSCISYMNLER